MIKYFIQNSDPEKRSLGAKEALRRPMGGVAIHPPNPDLHGSRIMVVIK